MASSLAKSGICPFLRCVPAAAAFGTNSFTSAQPVTNVYDTF